MTRRLHRIVAAVATVVVMGDLLSVSLANPAILPVSAVVVTRVSIRRLKM